MNAKPPVDTNIWVYAHIEESQDIRGPLAKASVDNERRFLISAQVLSEYYAAMLKNRADDRLIQQNNDRAKAFSD